MSGILAARLGTREALQAARGTAILIVVLFHADGWLSQYAHYMPFSNVRAFLKYLPMPVFFLSVGLSLAPAFERDNSPVYLARRAVHYGYLFLLWTLIDCIVTGFVTHGQSLTVSAWVKAFVHPPGVLWFLYALTAQLLLFGCIARCPKSFQLLVCLVMIFATLVVHGNVVAGAAQNMIFLFLGARYSTLFYKLVGNHSTQTLTWCLPAYAILATAMWLAGWFYIPVLTEVTCMVGVLALVSLWKLIPRSWAAQFAGSLGRLSFQIYVIHMYFVQAFAASVIWMGLDLNSNSALQYLLPLCSVAVSVLASFAVGTVIQNAKWLFGKPRLVAAFVDPVVATLVEAVAWKRSGRHYRPLAASDGRVT